MKTSRTTAFLLIATQLGAAVLYATPARSDGDAGKGATLYTRICARCHGPSMVNPGTLSFDLRKFPEDKPRFVDSVTNGKNNMPSFKGSLNERELDDIYAYVRTGGIKKD